ncbi:MAG: hypothetical protein ACOYJQ_09460 [Pseudochelatococcus sp.]|jgi:hypothetical protein|uniref:hypothetical protein n=1 Tax=Pseudochelatococcus sp. TaxID=2020869 RepID=UPI003D9254DC
MAVFSSTGLAGRRLGNAVLVADNGRKRAGYGSGNIHHGIIRGCTVTAECSVDDDINVIPDDRVAALSPDALRAIADAAIDIADARGTSRSTIGWNRQRALAERVLSRIYLAGRDDALRSS